MMGIMSDEFVKELLLRAKLMEEQRDELLEALKGLGDNNGNDWCFCQDDPGSAHTEGCQAARYAISKTEEMK
jgi:hypothetical protein